jgi:NhaP-type Na+/H+ or K+/H+ antiporter
MAPGDLVSLAVILGAGIAASWAAWRLRLPSILLLLLTGFALGPVADVLHPDALLGALLEPLVGAAVAVILFEGSLTLDLEELEEVGGPIRNLVTVGVAVTWVVGGLAAALLLGLPPGVSALLGAILVVTGPTVVLPLIRQVRLEGDLGDVLRWEGIVIDPVGVVLSVVAAEFLLAGGLAEATRVVVLTVGKALASGAVLGFAGGLLVAVALRRHLLPERLESPATLAVLLAAYVACEIVQPEAGLVGATVMGVTLANADDAAVREVLEFQENLRELLLPFVFIVLAARLDPSALGYLNAGAAAFVAVLVLVARPLAVAASTYGSSLGWRERAFAAALAPRGIVAAALSSVLALELQAAGVPGTEALVPVTFFTIVATVTLYGLGAAPLARRLGVADPDPGGLILVGAGPWARDAATRLQEAGVTVRLVDANAVHVRQARDKGLDAVTSSATDHHVLDKVPLGGIGAVFAATPNDEVNRLALQVFGEALDRSRLFSLPSSQGTAADGFRHLPAEVDADAWTRRWAQGWRTRVYEAPDPDPDAEDRTTDLPEDAIPLVVIEDDRATPLESTERDLDPGDRVLALVPPETLEDDEA